MVDRMLLIKVLGAWHPPKKCGTATVLHRCRYRRRYRDRVTRLHKKKIEPNTALDYILHRQSPGPPPGAAVRCTVPKLSFCECRYLTLRPGSCCDSPSAVSAVGRSSPLCDKNSGKCVPGGATQSATAQGQRSSALRDGHAPRQMADGRPAHPPRVTAAPPPPPVTVRSSVLHTSRATAKKFPLTLQSTHGASNHCSVKLTSACGLHAPALRCLLAVIALLMCSTVNLTQ